MAAKKKRSKTKASRVTAVKEVKDPEEIELGKVDAPEPADLKPEEDTQTEPPKIVTIRSRPYCRDQYRRAGFVFSRQPKTFDLSELSEDQVGELLGDPHLIIKEA